MIEVIKQQFAPEMSLENRTNVAREFLQILALKTIADSDGFKQLAFVGGTALRTIYGLRRFSEDLDFFLINSNGYEFKSLLESLNKSFILNGLKVSLKQDKEKTVNSAFVQFPGLSLALGLSGHNEQKLSIKIEVDVMPPAGWNLQTTVISRTYLFGILHYDLPSMFAGKLHACFYRRYTKGRDIYDLFWYVGRKVRPNYEMLNNAIAQTSGKSPGLNENNFISFLLENIGHVNMKSAKQDIERFLEDKSELKLFAPELLAGAIKSAYV